MVKKCPACKIAKINLRILMYWNCWAMVPYLDRHLWLKRNKRDSSVSMALRLIKLANAARDKIMEES